MTSSRHGGRFSAAELTWRGMDPSPCEVVMRHADQAAAGYGNLLWMLLVELLYN